jgi:UDP-N-acetylglucosamine 2-epimerase (non-hydrolysing)
LKYKVCTLVGTRPELIKLSRVIPELDRYFNHTLIHSGQNYDYTLNKIFFQDLKIRKPDYFLNVKDDVLSKLIANIIYKTDIIFEKIKPDALLVYGDTNTSLGILSAKRKKIPIFHMEAGNRCFDQRVPEEINRKIADHLSDVNMVISNQAKENLIREGINPEFIFKLGSNMFEVIDFYKNKINDSKILKKLSLQKDKFILVSLHREENVDNKINLKNIFHQLNKVHHLTKLKIIVSTHPRTQKKIKEFKLSNKNINFLKPFGFFDYCKLQTKAFCTISDSGTIFEEASILDFPAVTIRASHERQEGMEGGAVVVCSEKNQDINNAIKTVKKIKENLRFKVNDYHAPGVAFRVINIIESYISIINEKVWSKN